MSEARLAKCLETLRSQIDAMAPDRNKSSDGWIGDASHQASKSDHNPDANGVVHALDITDDPAHGVDASDLAEQIRISGDKRWQYVISDARIANVDIENGVWRPYTGSNPHNLHFHTSCQYEPELADDTSPWAIRLTVPTHEVSVVRPTIQYGSKGSAVKEAQMLLGDVAIDGNFGTETDTATRTFQSSVALPVDGIIGPYTWEALLRKPAILPIPPESSGKQVKITATVFSSTETGKKSAYGEWLEPSDLFVALPAAFADPRPFMRITGPKGTVIAQVKDKGPWYDGTPQRPADEYWVTGARPRAESDPATNSAGIDVSQAVADAVGVPGKGPVDWVFIGAYVPTIPAEPELPVPWPPVQETPFDDIFTVFLKMFTGGSGKLPNIPFGNPLAVAKNAFHLLALSKTIDPQRLTWEQITGAAVLAASELSSARPMQAVGRLTAPLPSPPLPPRKEIPVLGTNWKTTLSGIAALFTGLASLATAISTGHFDANSIMTALAGIAAAFGGFGLTQAKDNNVTGGTVGNQSGTIVNNNK